MQTLPMVGERECMRLHLETLFTHDMNGRMVRVNEPMGKPAPRFFLGRTKEGKVWRFRHDIDEDLVQELETVCMGEADGDEFLLPPHASHIYEALLARAAPVQTVWTGPAYRFPPEVPAPSDTVLITSENIDLLQSHFTEWLEDVALRQPFLALVHEGRALSVCCSVRITSAADEVGVETHPAFRRRGYAARVVAAWAIAVRALGRIPLYSTSWQNTASRAVAGKLGLVRYGTDLHIT